MTPRTFFQLFIKMVGIFLILHSLEVVLSFLTSLPFFADGGFSTFAMSMLITIIVLGFYCFVVLACLFRTDFIIDKLSLDKGFKEEWLPVIFDPKLVLNISIYVVGGMLIINSLPHFCQGVFESFHQREAYIPFNPIMRHLISDTLKMGIGLYLIIKNKEIIAYIERTSGKPQ